MVRENAAHCSGLSQAGSCSRAAPRIAHRTCFCFDFRPLFAGPFSFPSLSPHHPTKKCSSLKPPKVGTSRLLTRPQGLGRGEKFEGVATQEIPSLSKQGSSPTPWARGLRDQTQKWVLQTQKNPLFIGFSVLGGGLRPWSQTRPDHGVGVDPETVIPKNWHAKKTEVVRSC